MGRRRSPERGVCAALTQTIDDTGRVRRATKRAWGGYVPLICLCAGAGAGGLLADAVGAGETPIAIVGAVVGYLVSGSILRRIYSDDE